MNEYTQSALYYLRLIAAWKKQFLIITVIAIVASAVFSSEYFIKPRYKSSATVYPANIIPFSEESTTEQILQMLQSTYIRDAVIEKFDLYKHYKIDTSGKEARAAMNGMYKSFVNISKNEYESVDIEVTDTDPQQACDMVNEITSQLNQKISDLHKQKTREVKKIVEGQLNLKAQQLDSLGKGLQELRVKYQILDYNIQTAEVTKGYMKALSSGKTGGLKDIDHLLRNLEEKGGDYYKMKVAYDGVLGSYNAVRNEYDNILRELDKRFTYTYVVSAPTPADKKSYPIRWLIVLISVVAANTFLFAMIMLNDFRKKFQDFTK
jgi:capsular polysaccharide biosynthesis protein